MANRYAVLVIWLLGLQSPLAANEDAFNLSELPPGKNITLVKPATTNIPLDDKVELSPTDAPQTISFRAVTAEGEAHQPIAVEIFDKDQKKLGEVRPGPNNTAIYTFTRLSQVTAVAQKIHGHPAEHVLLQVSSDKPLTIAH